MKLTSPPTIISLSDAIPVYDLEVDSPNHNFCLSNGVVVHNSKDTADAVFGALYSCYKDQEEAFSQVEQKLLEDYANILKAAAKRNRERMQFKAF